MKTKNLFLGVLAMTGMLFATSCSQDEVLLNEPSSENLVSATFTINSPVGIDTRAIGEADYVNKVVCATYDEDGVELTDLRQYLTVQDKKAEYSIRLVKGQNYRVAFFAYCAADGSDAPIHYDVTDLKNIKVLDAQSSNVEKRDAFTAYTDVKTGETMQPINRTVYLYRPFAQLNLGSEIEDWNAAVSAGVEVAYTKVIVSNVYKTFSAYDDEVVGEAEAMTFELNDIPAQDLSANGKVYKYLAMNYLLVGDAGSEKTLTDVTFEWLGKNGETNDPVTVFKNIPVQRNYRTNIIGYLLTNPAKFNIVVEEAFEEPDYNIAVINGTVSASDVVELVANDGSIVDEPATLATIADKNFTSEGTALVVDELPTETQGVLCIKNSVIDAKTFLSIDSHSTVIIDNCYLKVDEVAVNNINRWDVQLIFSNSYVNGTPVTSANLSTFIDLDKFGAAFAFFEESPVTNVTTSGELNVAVAAGKKDIEVAAGTYAALPSGITAGTTITCEPGTVFHGSGFNIGGATIIGAEFNSSATYVTVNGTFKNCSFTGGNGLRWGYAGETVVFEDCEFSGSLYGVHFDGGANDVVFRNCVLSGFNALGAAITQLTLENCTFKSNGLSGYNGANLWGNTKLIGCEFTFDGSASVEWIDCCGTNKDYEFTNCTVNGAPYTPANYKDKDYKIQTTGSNVTIKINGVECEL